MIADAIKFRGHLCFRDDWSGFDEIRPINVVIGRNNTGKSQLLDFIETLCSDRRFPTECEYQCSGTLNEQELRRFFPSNRSGGSLHGNHWTEHGAKLVGTQIGWHINKGVTSGVTLEDGRLLAAAGADILSRLVTNSTFKLTGSIFRRLLADRDIRPERQAVDLYLGSDGRGASNIIRRFLLSSNPSLRRDVIREDLLTALNQIFREDGQFTEIQVNVHDDNPDEGNVDLWEIFLGEKSKGLIPLSKSGSGLKTVILVLLNLLVVPKINNRPPSEHVFAFEELENNLHPALLRRLLLYISSYASKENTPVFISTHSSVALDLFGTSESAQIVHVLHNGKSARTETVAAHFDRLGVVTELGAKPSDLLQANGVVWVEGPSDRIYVNHWIALCSNGILKEGVNYQCAYFGGALLAKVTFGSGEEEHETELANLLKINSNLVVVCDSDRTSKGARLKERVRRVRDEVRLNTSAHIWITSAKEIENYIPGAVLSSVFGIRGLPDPQQYMNFFPRKSARHRAYIAAHLHGRNVDKVKLATLGVRYMERTTMAGRFDWELEMKKLVRRIESWNR